MNKSQPDRREFGFESRNIALNILMTVEQEGGYANLITPQELRKAKLEPRDSAFVTELVYGTIRKRSLYDAIIESAAARKTSKIDLLPLNILRLTAHQLLTLETARHAAVDTAVRLAVKNKHGSASGFVNAVARRISEKSMREWVHNLTQILEPIDALSIKFAHPRWIVESYLARLGNLEEVERELIANNVNPLTTAVVYPGDEWSRSTLEASQSALWSASCRYVEGNPELLPEIRSGAAGIQDQGSFLVAQALARVPTETSSDGLWLDMCAGPGGKAALLDRWATQSGNTFLGLEISEHRAALINRVSRSVVVADGVQPPIHRASAEKILLDAPCSGLGALRRRPDARHRKTRAGVIELVQLQRSLLKSAIELLTAGGVLGYVTCSPVIEETEANTAWLLENFKEMELIDARPYFPSDMHLGESFDVQLWPGKHNTDGMYLALFKKLGKSS